MSDSSIDKILESIITQFIPVDQVPNVLLKSTQDYFSIRAELMKESDRGCALLATSQLELGLENLLRKKLVGNKKHKDSLLDFNGCLGTFSSRIQLSYSIGLISKMDVDELTIIRKVRNEFGHSHQAIDFTNPKIRMLCDQLKFHRPSNVESRSKFTASVSFIMGGLIGMTYKEQQIMEKVGQNEEDIKAMGIKVDTLVSKLYDSENK